MKAWGRDSLRIGSVHPITVCKGIPLPADTSTVKMDMPGSPSPMTLNIHITQLTSFAFILSSPGTLLHSASVDIETKSDIL